MRPHDEIRIKVDQTVKFTGLLYCNRIDEAEGDTGRKRQTQGLRETENGRMQTDGDRESCPALGLIKLPLLALIQKDDE